MYFTRKKFALYSVYVHSFYVGLVTTSKACPLRRAPNTSNYDFSESHTGSATRIFAVINRSGVYSVVSSQLSLVINEGYTRAGVDNHTQF